MDRIKYPAELFLGIRKRNVSFSIYKRTFIDFQAFIRCFSLQRTPITQIGWSLVNTLCCISLCRCCYGLYGYKKSKIRPIHATQETLTDFHGDEAKINKMADSRTSIYPSHLRTNPSNFREKILRIGGNWKTQFFWVSH